MQQKIIIFLVITFIASSFWLFHVSNKFIDPNDGKNWWTLSFTDPKSQNLEFTIENHSDKTDFHWTVSNKNQKIKEGDAQIEKGNSKSISPGDVQSSEKVTVEVFLGDENREIYKFF